MQFYSTSSHPTPILPAPPEGATLTSNSSSSSLSSMTAALVGPPILPYSSSAASSMNHHLESQSPISPAALIDSHENLMLPPAPREQHLSWLTHINALARAASTKPEETEEKREKRLERNRESARKCRRRKKERLEALAKQVNGLHRKIDQQRHVLVDVMLNDGLAQNRSADAAAYAIRRTGPQSPLVQAVLEFHSTTLKQRLLPRYQKYWYWIALQDESFFVAGKETLRTGRTSSKQIGEELMKPTHDQGPGKADLDGTSERASQTSYAHDAARSWPLFCYEMSLSVDQEDKILAARKKNRPMGRLQESRQQAAALMKTVDSVRDAFGSMAKVVSEREERGLLSILSSEQTQRYQVWLQNNRPRCRSLVQQHASDGKLPPQDASLEVICERLSRVLQISTRPPQQG